MATKKVVQFDFKRSHGTDEQDIFHVLYDDGEIWYRVGGVGNKWQKERLPHDSSSSLPVAPAKDPP